MRPTAAVTTTITLDLVFSVFMAFLLVEML
jgi:hypothetical protein